jgi:hypothetical protein
MKLVSPVGKNKMKVLLGTLIGFIILDGLLTEFLLNRGMAREVYPLGCLPALSKGGGHRDLGGGGRLRRHRALER